MLVHLMKHEWRNLIADRVPVAIALVLGLAIAYGAFNGSQWVKFQESTLAQARAEDRERFDAIRAEIPTIDSGEKKVSAFADPRLPQSFGRNMGLRYAAMPPAPLASLAVGQSDLLPYYFRVSTNSKETFVSNDEIENPVHLLAGRFDLAFVFLYLFPLVILAFSYNVVSEEKETGTLALALSQAVSLNRIVLAKVTLRALYVLAISLVLSVAGVVLGGADLSAPGAGLGMILWIGVTAAYGAFWFAVAIAVNALGRSSATNAMTLAGIWLLLVVVVPSVLNVAVKTRYPVPSRVEMIQAIRSAGEESTRQGSSLLAQYLEDHPELAPKQNGGEPPDFGTLLVALNDATERKVQPVVAEFDRQLAQQQAMVGRFRYLSPAILAQSAFYDIAGSGEHRYKHFLVQVDEFHRRWRGFFVPRILRKEKLTVSDLDEVPVFAFASEDPGAVARRQAGAFSGLIVSAFLIGLVASKALRRYSVAS
jgi:ABC-2 type transport system permease protein